MDIQRTQVRGHRTVFCDHLRAVWGVKSAPSTLTTNNAISQNCQNTDSQHLDRSCYRHTYGNFRFWLLGASATSDCKLPLCCYGRLACVPMEARVSGY